MEEEQYELDNNAIIENEEPKLEPPPQISSELKKNPEVPKEKHFIMTNNDAHWADTHCVYLFDKYIHNKSDTEEVNIESHISNVFKDLNILFRIDEANSIREKAEKEFKAKPTHPNKIFKEKLYEWIAEFRELSISTHLGEGINLINDGFSQNEDKLDEFIKEVKIKDPSAMNRDKIRHILPKIFEILQIRLLCLDYSIPKDDYAIVKPEQELEYAQVIVKLAEEHKISEINPDNLKNLILSYLKSGPAKYTFAFVPKIDETHGLDPYTELGDVTPGQGFESMKSIKDLRSSIELKIQEAEEDGYNEKASILKKMKQLLDIKKLAQNKMEEESIDFKLQELQQQLDELESPYIIPEGEGEGEGEGEDENVIRLINGNDISKTSQRGETLEERRTKGLKEIFNYYARSQMLIGK